ncbi:MAG: hypothetical protein U1D55_11125 [Phycisphaerae bacterium]
MLLVGGCPSGSALVAGTSSSGGAPAANGAGGADFVTGSSATDGSSNAGAVGDSSSGGATDSAGLASLSVFPPDNPWNQDVSAFPVHPNSTAYIANIGLDVGLHPDFGTVWEGAPIGIPYTLMNADTPRVNVSFDYADESDPGPYPIPADALIEGGPNADGDRHVLLVDAGAKKLYELFYAYPQADGSWTAGSGAIYDLSSNALRPAGWTSADAAGLPIFPGLVRYDEVVERKEITHALRFTVSKTQHAYIPPATHFASSSTDPARPPMGLRVRLRADFDLSGFSPNVQVILRAMKKYGMFVADNGSNWYISGAPDARWNDDELHELGRVRGRDLEAVYTGESITN